MNKYYLKRLLSAIFIIAVILGGFFVSYDIFANIFRFYYFLFYLVGCIIIIPTFLRVYWYIKSKRETRTPSKLAEVYIDHAKDLVTDKEKMLSNITSTIIELGGDIIEKNLDQVPRVIFYFPQEHKYNFFHRTTVKVLSVNEITIETMMKSDQPLAFSIKRKSDKEIDKINKVQLPKSSILFNFHSNNPSFYASLLEKEEIHNLLISLKNQLLQFALNRKFVVARFRNLEDISPYLDLLAILHEEIILKEFDAQNVEDILCYHCGNVFETNEEICDKCGAHRPTCKVCLLDLQPSEKEEIVKSPCCSTYFHRNHLIAWLEEHTTCPFCKNEAFLWLRGLKQNNDKK
jgi:hypothetical protein